MLAPSLERVAVGREAEVRVVDSRMATSLLAVAGARAVVVDEAVAEAVEAEGEVAEAGVAFLSTRRALSILAMGRIPGGIVHVDTLYY